MLAILRTILILSIFITSKVYASQIASKFRVVWSQDPATSATIGFEALIGENQQYKISYKIKDIASEFLSVSVDDYRKHKGMINAFGHLKNLKANTAYQFYISLDNKKSQIFWFKTAPSENDQRLSFISGGDSRNNRDVRKNANILVSKLRVDAVLFGGDMTGSDNSSQWKNWFIDWQLTFSKDGRITPIVPTRGNHERSNDSISKLFAVPSSVYYAFDIGRDLFRVYTLNTESSIAGDQSLWLKNDLQKNSNRIWKFAQYHRPMRAHTSGKSEGNRQYKAWSKLFYDYEVNLVSESDSHTVKTTYPIRPFTGEGSDEGFIRDDERGTVYVGEGCWGAPLRKNNDDKTWTRASNRFNQFKLIFVDKSKMELRTLYVDNARDVEEVKDNNRFNLPKNLKVWAPSNGSGKVVKFNKSSLRLAFLSPQVGDEIRLAKPFTVNVKVTDELSKIKNVKVFGNTKLIHESNKGEFSFSTQVNLRGDFVLSALATNEKGEQKESRDLSLFIGRKLKKTYSEISKNEDDAIERVSGRMVLNGEKIKLGSKGGNKFAAFLFRNLALKNDSEIKKAHIQFTSASISRKEASLSISASMIKYGESITNKISYLTDLNKTNMEVPWDVSKWKWWGLANSNQRTPNLSELFSEVIKMDSWKEKDSLIIIISGEGERVLRARDKGLSDAPKLLLEFK